ncbi:MAG: class I SAM-dependent methyltransferase [Anaerolineae bacterium]|nr:class I SAM-dependent methyltransferase [Anaerolineae bacterium]
MEQTWLLTNEEKRVSTYHTEMPTAPRLVTPATSLGELNLNWREKDLPQRKRTKHVHRLHPYLGKFIPQLVEIFLRKYFKAGETVYDPFCGSGTTLVEASVLNINSIGCDIAAFNCLLSRVKTAEYDVDLMKKEVLDILTEVEDRTQTTLFSQQWADDKFEDTDNEYLLRWFASQARKELLIYRSLIPNYRYQELLKVILSRAARSARLTTHFDLDFPKQPQTEPYYCYKHSRICRPVQEAFKFLKRYSLDTIRRVEEYNKLRTKAKVTVLWGDARIISLPSKIDGVITSPPYVGLIDYHEQHRYAYELLGLPTSSENEIGAAFKGNSQSAKEAYQRGIASVFAHTGEYMDSSKRMIIVVRDRDNLYDDIAAQCGFELENTIQRHVNRRTGRRANEFFEEVLIWRKK